MRCQVRDMKNEISIQMSSNRYQKIVQLPSILRVPQHKTYLIRPPKIRPTTTQDHPPLISRCCPPFVWRHPRPQRQVRLNWIFITFFCTFFLLHGRLFSWKEGLNQKKKYLGKVDGSAQKPRGWPLFRPCQPFWGPIAVILNVWGSHRRNT